MLYPSMMDTIQVNIHPFRTANSLANKNMRCIQGTSFHKKGHWTLNSLILWLWPRVILTLVLSMKMSLNTSRTKLFLYYLLSSLYTLKPGISKGNKSVFENQQWQKAVCWDNSFFPEDFKSLLIRRHPKMALLTFTERITQICS